MNDEARSIADRIAAVQARIAAAAARAQRSPDEITLIAVTKTHPARRIAHVLASGGLDLGENRVREAEEKHEFFATANPPPRWHLIGHLQRNKARRALGLFDLIHSVDDLRLAETLNRLVDADSATGQRRLPILLQVNVSGEATKQGFSLIGGADSASWPAFLATVRQIVALPLIEVQGLMTIAPYSDDLEGVVRPCFRSLRAVRDRLATEVPAGDWRHLSMGMSGDFELAIEEGATLVRVGTAIFGER